MDDLELLRPDIPRYETKMLLYQGMQALIAVVIVCKACLSYPDP